MAEPFPYKVEKRKRLIDEEGLASRHRHGLEFITVERTTPQNDPTGTARYWHYFKVTGWVDPLSSD